MSQPPSRVVNAANQPGVPPLLPPAPSEKIGMVKCVEGIAYRALNTIETFWFVPIGLAVLFGLGRQVIPLNMLSAAVGTIGGIFYASSYKGNLKPDKDEKKMGDLIGKVGVIAVLSIFIGAVLPFVRNKFPSPPIQVARALNIATGSLGVVLSGGMGLLTGQARVYSVLGSTKPIAEPVSQNNPVLPGPVVAPIIPPPLPIIKRPLTTSALSQAAFQVILSRANQTITEIAAVDCEHDLQTLEKILYLWTLALNVIDDCNAKLLLASLSQREKSSEKTDPASIADCSFTLRQKLNKDSGPFSMNEVTAASHPVYDKSSNAPSSNMYQLLEQDKKEKELKEAVANIRQKKVEPMWKVINQELLLLPCVNFTVTPAGDKNGFHASLREQTGETAKTIASRVTNQLESVFIEPKDILETIDDPSFRRSELFQQALKDAGVPSIFPLWEDSDLGDSDVCENDCQQIYGTENPDDARGFFAGKPEGEGLPATRGEVPAYLNFDNGNIINENPAELFKMGMPSSFFPKSQYDRMTRDYGMTPGEVKLLCQLYADWTESSVVARSHHYDCSNNRFGMNSDGAKGTFLGRLGDMGDEVRQDWQKYLSRQQASLPIFYPKNGVNYYKADVTICKSIDAIKETTLAYIKNLRNQTTLLELRAAAKSYERLIVIVEDDEMAGLKGQQLPGLKVRQVIEPSIVHALPLYLKYNNGRYDIMKPKKG